MDFNTSKVIDNEVVKASDFDYGFKSFINNFSLGMKLIMLNNKSFVIGGKVRVSNSGGFNLAIDPIYSYSNEDDPTLYPIVANDEVTDLISLQVADSSDRIDIIEVCGINEEYDEQQRALNDAETGLKTYPIINTKQRVKLKVNVKKGIPGQTKAPNKTEGYVKIAEIKIPANATVISNDNIYNITADIDGLNNSDWTTEKDATIKISSVSELYETFRVNHEKNGSYKSKSVKTSHIDFGTNADQVNGNVIPTGGTEQTFGSESIIPSDKLSVAISKIATQFNSLYNLYLKIGAFKYNGEVQIGSVLNSDKTEIVKPLIIGAAGDGSAYIKIGTKNILTISALGILTVPSGYSATNTNDLITKSITDALSSRIDATESDISSLKEATAGFNVYTNELLSRYQYKTSVKVATTANITLSGVQTIDGVPLAVNDTVLVKNQTTKKQNGIYTVQTGAWNRTTNYTKGNETNIINKLFYPLTGTQAGKFYYIPDTSITLDTSNINFIESIYSSSNIAGKAVIRDKDGNFAAGTISASCFCGNVKGNVTGNVTGDVTGNVAGTSSYVCTTKSNECKCFLPLLFVNNPTSCSGSGFSSRVSNSLLVYNNSDVAANTQGTTYLQLGNALATATACNSRGYLRIYGTGTTYSQLIAQNPSTSNTVCLPIGTGTLALTSGCVACAGKDGSGCAFGTAARCAATAFLGACSQACCAAKVYIKNGSTSDFTNFDATGCRTNPTWVWGWKDINTQHLYLADCLCVWYACTAGCAGQVMIGGTAATLGTAAKCDATAFRASTWTPSCVACAGKDGSGCAFGTAARYACTCFLKATAKACCTAIADCLEEMGYIQLSQSLVIRGTVCVCCQTLGSSTSSFTDTINNYGGDCFKGFNIPPLQRQYVFQRGGTNTLCLVFPCASAAHPVYYHGCVICSDSIRCCFCGCATNNTPYKLDVCSGGTFLSGRVCVCAAPFPGCWNNEDAPMTFINGALISPIYPFRP